MRLDRLLSECGAGTRREVVALVRAGRVCVDGEVVRDASAHVRADVVLSIDHEPVVAPPKAVLWHKPLGVLCTYEDPWGRAGLDSVLPMAWRRGLHPVGRLDQDTTGLLLFSSDGTLTQSLLHPKRGVLRRYVAGLEVDAPADLVALLAAGVETAAGTFSATVISQAEREVTLEVAEGKYRMVRRLLANAGAPVSSLHRLSYGPLALGELSLGEMRPVEPHELAALRASCGLGPE